MKRFVIAALLMVLCACATTQTGQVDYAREVMVKSGMETDLNALEAAWNQGIDQGLAIARNNAQAMGDETRAEFIERLVPTLKGVLDPERFLNLTHEKINADVTKQEMREVIAWFESPLGKKIVRIEKEYTKKQPQVTADMAGAILANYENPRERAALVKEFVRATEMTDKMFVVMENMSVAMTLSMMAVLAPEKVTVDEARKIVIGQLQAAKPMFEAQIYYGCIACYKDLTNEELAAYTRFSETKASQKVMDARISALDVGFKETGDKAGDAIAKLIKDLIENGVMKKA